jgi:hypothetical protein
MVPGFFVQVGRGTMKKLLLVILTFGLAGCINPYAQFYQGAPDARKIPGYEPSEGKLQIYRTDNFKRDIPALIRRGYQPIGHVSFNGPNRLITEMQLREQAAKIGAQAVLVSQKYAYTASGAMPLTLPQTSTSFSTGTATAYGPAGSVTAYGNGMTTTYGTQTVMMPFSIPHFDFGAVFFAKIRMCLGVSCAPTDDATRRRLQTNAGVKVLVVVDGSPAFKDNILAGDIIMAMGNDPIDSVEDFHRLINEHQGQTVIIHLNRDGKPLEKKVTLSSF